MTYKILLVGTGNLGIRYLQGLLKVNQSLIIHAYDINSIAIKKAKRAIKSLIDIKKKKHKVLFIKKIPNKKIFYEIAIIASTSKKREKVIYNLAKTNEIKYWILEKVLAQNITSLIRIKKTLNSQMAWVNTPHRTMKWFHRIKENSLKKKIFVLLRGQIGGSYVTQFTT